MNEEKRQHLEFIQRIITRMNTNSFNYKWMNVVLFITFLAIYATTENSVFIFIALFPAIVFWFLDSYYLQQERKFRGIYNDVADENSGKDIKNYAMPTNEYKGGKYSFFNVFFSKTILLTYLPIVIILVEKE